jgi:hypothetical protein
MLDSDPHWFHSTDIKSFTFFASVSTVRTGLTMALAPLLPPAAPPTGAFAFAPRTFKNERIQEPEDNQNLEINWYFFVS